jgi:hypothetical protein
MRATNPAFIPRNHLVEETIIAAVNDGAFGFRVAVVGGFRALRGSASVRTIRRSAAARSGRAPNVLRHLTVLGCMCVTINTRRTLIPTSSSAHPVDIVRIFRMAEEPAPALVATPHEAQKTILDQTLRSKR